MTRKGAWSGLSSTKIPTRSTPATVSHFLAWKGL
jgi:hypothetical protein